MDSGVDEELNYEEDELENDESCKDSENREGTQDSVTNNSNMESDDQYLQIDYLEDENLPDEAVPMEGVTPTSDPTPTSDNNEEAKEKNEDSNQEKVTTVKQDLNLLGKSGNNVGNVTKRKKRLRPFQRRVEFKKKLTNAFCLNPWLPDYNFIDRQRQQVAQFLSRNLMLSAKQEFYPIQGSPLPQLMPNSKGNLHSPSPRLGIGVSSQSFLQQSNNLTASMLGQPFNGDGSGCQIENGQVLLSRSFGMKPDVFSKGCGISNSSGFDQKNFNRTKQPYGNSFQANSAPKNGYKPVFYNGSSATNGAFPPGAAFGEKSKCFPVKTEDRCINNVQYKPFQEEEKKVLMMKKEARLKRFMQDDLIKKDKFTDSGFEESSQYGSPPKVQLLEKREKKLITGEQREYFVSCNLREGAPEKPDINKELLLRKKNPFGGNVGTSNFNLATKANRNQNEKIDGVKVERVDTQVCTTTSTWEQPTKVEAKPPAPGPGFGPIKTETEPHVRFIRTISKSFDELTFRKPKIEIPEPQEKLFPSLHPQKLGESFPKQIEPQLTGCIVKVLNIPPSTTTNDILALCSPIGIVMEVKLNCPKENSVVIRFAEPKFAEKFFSLYHGQKMNNYFLNVIVV